MPVAATANAEENGTQTKKRPRDALHINTVMEDVTMSCSDNSRDDEVSVSAASRCCFRCCAALSAFDYLALLLLLPFARLTF